MQRQTFRYFWDFAHPTSGLARERSNQAFGYGPEVVTTGGSGFGIMTIIVAIERRWLSRQEALDRLLEMVRFLDTADSYHGILPHFLNGETGRTIPFTRKDDGGDLVETSLLLAGLCAPVSTSIATMPGSASCGTASMRSGVKPNGTGTRRAVANCCIGTGARTTAGASITKSAAGTNA